MSDPRSSQISTRSGATTTTTTVSHDHRPVAGLSVPQVVGGALAAVTTAVAASFLGVAGTLIGAAVGSVISTLATTIYSNSLSRAARVSRTLVVRRAVAPERPNGAPSEAPDADGEPGEKVVEYTTRSRTGTPEAVGTGPLWSRIRWKPVALAAGLVFVAALAVISVSETILGHPLSNSAESGTTLSNIGGSAPTSSQPSTPTRTTQTGSPTAT